MNSLMTFNTVKSWTRAGSWAGSGGRDPPVDGKAHAGRPYMRHEGSVERDAALEATLPAAVVQDTDVRPFTVCRPEQLRPAPAEANGAAHALVAS